MHADCFWYPGVDWVGCGRGIDSHLSTENGKAEFPLMANKVILVGHVGKDPEIRDVGGQRVANLSLATNERRKSGDDWEKYTEWHRLTVWGRLVDVVEKYVTSGKQIYIEGSIHTRKWEKDGRTNYSTEITVRELELLGKKEQQQPVAASPDISFTGEDAPF